MKANFLRQENSENVSTNRRTARLEIPVGLEYIYVMRTILSLVIAEENVLVTSMTDFPESICKDFCGDSHRDCGCSNRIVLMAGLGVKTESKLMIATILFLKSSRKR